MKTRGFDFSIGKTTLTLLSLVKLSILSSLIILFLNVTLSLYSTVSTHHYFSVKQPIYSISIPFPIYQSDSNTIQASSSSALHTNVSQSPTPSKSDHSTVSSPLPSTFPSSNSKDLNSSISNSATSSPNDYLNSSITMTQNTEKPAARKRLVPKGCDLSKGEWVEDPNAPYYTNSTCWMIQEHQNCIKHGRPNLEFLKWRWKPDGCELPLLDPAQFLQLMRGKVLAFIGDSLARNQMQSLMCLLSRVEYPKELSSSSDNPTLMFYPNHNFTINFFWSPFLIRAEQSNFSVHGFPCYNLYLDEPDPLWPALLPSTDFVVLNSGNWFTRPSLFHLNRTLAGCHHCPINAPFLSPRRAHRRAFRTALDSIIAAKRRGFCGLTVVRTVSPSHFEGGDWDRGGDCGRARPLRAEAAAPRLEGMEREMYEEQVREFWRAKWEGKEEGLEFRLMDATRAMLMRPDGHPSRYGHGAEETVVMQNDCVHWCLPGPVDMWNDFLFRVLTV